MNIYFIYNTSKLLTKTTINAQFISAFLIVDVSDNKHRPPDNKIQLNNS